MIMQKDLNEDTEMAVLVPTIHGKGFLTCALVDHLVSLHNDVIKKSREFVEITLERYDFLLHQKSVSVILITKTLTFF